MLETAEIVQLRLGSSLQISKSLHLRYPTGTASTFANLKFVSEEYKIRSRLSMNIQNSLKHWPLFHSNSPKSLAFQAQTLKLLLWAHTRDPSSYSYCREHLGRHIDTRISLECNRRCLPFVRSIGRQNTYA